MSTTTYSAEKSILTEAMLKEINSCPSGTLGEFEANTRSGRHTSHSGATYDKAPREERYHYPKLAFGGERVSQLP